MRALRIAISAEVCQVLGKATCGAPRVPEEIELDVHFRIFTA
jgi:hypothetical protein